MNLSINQVNSFKDMKDADLICNISRSIINSKNAFALKTYNLNNINERFDFIKFLIESIYLYISLTGLILSCI